MELPFIRITTREGDVEQSIEVGQAPGRLTNLSLALDAEPILGTIETITAQAAAANDALEWSATLCDGERVNYAKAQEAVDALNAALRDGEPRWRIPERFELESILDLTRHDPAVDTTRFPDTQSGYYWTATPCAWAPAFAWVVGFGGGDVYGYCRDYSLAFVRAVRSAAVPAGQ